MEAESIRTYIAVFIALMLLLILSVVVAQWDLGAWNIVVALAISAAKAVLVLLFFMHLIDSPSLIRVVAVGGLLWMVFLFALTFADYQTRTWDEDNRVPYRSTPLDRRYEE